MNPKERLKRIEIKAKDLRGYSIIDSDCDLSDDVYWLIARVKHLERALEKINDPKRLKNNVSLTSYPPKNAGVWDIQNIAREALEGEVPDEKK